MIDHQEKCPVANSLLRPPVSPFIANVNNEADTLWHALRGARAAQDLLGAFS